MAQAEEIAELLQTPRDYIRWACSEFESAGLCFGHGCDNALDEAAALVLQCLHLPLDLPAAYLDGVLTAAERQRLLDWIGRRRDQRLPLPYISGRAWFAGLEFVADARALVPRSPIAELIAEGFEPWLQQTPEHILDLCTGGGCIAIACAHVFDAAQVDATDLSAEALAQAAENVRAHGLEERLQLLRGDLFQACPERRQYDLIVSNPPYVGASEYANLPAEFQHEPRGALETGQQGLDLALQILAQAADYLRPGGLLVCEVGAGARELAAARPDLALEWPEFENGGDGVFIIAREQLVGA